MATVTLRTPRGNEVTVPGTAFGPGQPFEGVDDGGTVIVRRDRDRPGLADLQMKVRHTPPKRGRRAPTRVLAPGFPSFKRAYDLQFGDQVVLRRVDGGGGDVVLEVVRIVKAGDAAAAAAEAATAIARAPWPRTFETVITATAAGEREGSYLHVPDAYIQRVFGDWDRENAAAYGVTVLHSGARMTIWLNRNVGDGLARFTTGWPELQQAAGLERGNVAVFARQGNDAGDGPEEERELTLEVRARP